MNFVRNIVARFLEGVEAGTPSGYHSSSGVPESYVTLRREIEKNFDGMDVTPDMVRDAMLSPSQAPASAKPIVRRRRAATAP